jgi:hypothetical protein
MIVESRGASIGENWKPLQRRKSLPAKSAESRPKYPPGTAPENPSESTRNVRVADVSPDEG